VTSRDLVRLCQDHCPETARALTEAERSAAYRGRRKAELEAEVPVRIRYRRPADKRTRPQRWRDAVAELVDLQADYAAWLDRLPESLRDTATAEALQAIAPADQPRSYQRRVTPPSRHSGHR
jgi:hypothetical protein